MMKNKSPYSKTPIKDFYLDVWVPKSVLPKSDDIYREIPPKFHKRPDLMAHVLYGSEKLWWVFALRNINTLIDPFEDFTAGTKIWIPSAVEGVK